MAYLKLNEAECLIFNGLFDGAYYLGGYAVELMLKAKVCKTLGIDDFFAFDTHWSIVGAWSENTRYLTGRSGKDAQDFLISVVEIVKWIEKYL